MARARCGRRLLDVRGCGDGLGHLCIDVAAVGGDGEPLAHVEGEADDLAEIAAEAGASVQGGTRPRGAAPPFAADRAEGDITQIDGAAALQPEAWTCAV